MSTPRQALLDQPPARAVETIGTRLLEAASGALQHLTAGTDPEALHDFRVAVRRLRSTLSAWKGTLRDSVRPEHRKALRALQRRTGEARDAEVALAWLDDLPAPAKDEAAGFAALRSRFERRSTGASNSWAELVVSFDALDATLREALAGAASDDQTFARALARRVRRHAKRLRRRVRRACETGDPAYAHEARIWGKRLRYLVEPVSDLAPHLVKQCKKLQAILGELNDADVLEDEVTQEIRADVDVTRAGLHAAQSMARNRRQDSFAALRAWYTQEQPALRRSVRRLVRALEEAAATPEIEQTFLLTGMPTLPEHATILEIEQGYLSGPHAEDEERIRLTRSAQEVTYVRTHKRGTGLERLEFEEHISASKFEALWPKTQGHRVRKRRHVATHGALQWEVDEFLDRGLVLAEVELPTANTVAPVPAWLAPFVDREVTDDPAFSNRALAR